MQIGELLTGKARKFLILSLECPVAEAVERMAQEGVEAAVVADAGRPVGMFSGQDLLRLLQTKTTEAPQRTALGEAMSDQFVVASSEEEIRPVMAKMLDGGIRHLVVASGDAVLGQLPLCEIVKKMFDVLDSELRHLNDYIADLHEAGMD
ncbi:MAG: CBS domain-containing protein [Desulfobacterales bacterium]|nr:CBS domain-containing protein [Desulfobacterales bacterium]